MTLHLLLVLLVAALFYAAIPLLGGVRARERWRVFRAAITAASRFPLAGPPAAGRADGPVGRFRFFGTLEAIQGNDRIWLTNGRASVAAELRGVRVFLIPDQEDTGCASVPWNRLFSLPEGTPVFVAGTMHAEEGRGVFRHDASVPLIVVIHDCPPGSILPRAVGSGRQRNEYMNAFTLPSVGIGSLLLLFMAFTYLAIPEPLSKVLAFTAALAPLAPFLPPGVPLYFAYRGAWKRGRLLRAERDVVRLPLRWFPVSAAVAPRARSAAILPTMEPYAMIRGSVDPAEPGVLVADGERIELPPGTERMEVDLPALGRRPDRGPGPDAVVFSGYVQGDDGVRLVPTEDPMAGTVLVPGIPDAISRACERAARRLAALSGLYIALNVAVNLPLLFVLVAFLTR